MKQFAMETEKMGMQQEMMQDQFEMMSDPAEESQAEDVYAQILGEIGMQMNDDMSTNNNQIAQPAGAGAQQNAADPDLQARLDALKGM